LKIALELTEVRWGDLLGFEFVAVGGGEPRGERIEVTEVVLGCCLCRLGVWERKEFES
jgi:hypothetical protein